MTGFGAWHFLAPPTGNKGTVVFRKAAQLSQACIQPPALQSKPQHSNKSIPMPTSKNGQGENNVSWSILHPNLGNDIKQLPEAASQTHPFSQGLLFALCMPFCCRACLQPSISCGRATAGWCTGDVQHQEFCKSSFKEHFAVSLAPGEILPMLGLMVRFCRANWLRFW